MSVDVTLGMQIISLTSLHECWLIKYSRWLRLLLVTRTRNHFAHCTRTLSYCRQNMESVLKCSSGGGDWVQVDSNQFVLVDCHRTKHILCIQLVHTRPVHVKHTSDVSEHYTSVHQLSTVSCSFWLTHGVCELADSKMNSRVKKNFFALFFVVA